MLGRATVQRAGGHGADQPLGLHVRHQAHHQATQQGSHSHGDSPTGGILQRHQRKHQHADDPQHGTRHRLQGGNAHHQIAHHVRVIGIRRALPAQYRREKNQGHGDTRDDREQEITQVQRRGGGVGIGESLGFIEWDEEPQERGHAQGAHHVGHQNRRRIQRPSCLAGPGNIAKELCHEEQPN